MPQEVYYAELLWPWDYLHPETREPLTPDRFIMRSWCNLISELFADAEVVEA